MVQKTRRGFIATITTGSIAFSAGCLGSGSSTDDRTCTETGCGAGKAVELMQRHVDQTDDFNARITKNGGFGDIGGWPSLLARHSPSTDDVSLVETPSASSGAEILDDIIDIADVYASAVVDGFEIGDLDGEVVASVGEENADALATWNVKYDWAESHVTGAWDETRYRSAVLETFDA